MPNVLIFRPDGSFYYNTITDTKEIDPTNILSSCTGFSSNGYIYVFRGTPSDKRDDNFNFISTEAFKLVESGGNQNIFMTGNFIITRHMNGNLMDITYEDFHSARNEYITSSNRSQCTLF